MNLRSFRGLNTRDWRLAQLHQDIADHLEQAAALDIIIVYKVDQVVSISNVVNDSPGR